MLTDSSETEEEAELRRSTIFKDADKTHCKRHIEIKREMEPQGEINLATLRFAIQADQGYLFPVECFVSSFVVLLSLPLSFHLS